MTASHRANWGRVGDPGVIGRWREKGSPRWGGRPNPQQGSPKGAVAARKQVCEAEGPAGAPSRQKLTRDFQAVGPAARFQFMRRDFHVM